MDQLQKVAAAREAAVREYTDMVDDESVDWSLPETIEKEGNLKSAIKSLDARAKALKDREKMAGEDLFKDQADREGVSLDEKMSKVDIASKAMHNFMLAQIGGGSLSEAEADLLGVNPETLRPSKQAIDGGADSRGAVSIPTEVASMVTERMKHYSVMRQVGTVETSLTGRDIVMVTEDDTAQIGEIIDPGNVDADDPPGATAGARAFGSKTLKFDLYSSKRVRLAKQYIRDTATPSVIARMSNKLGQRIGRGQEAAFANGSGGLAGASNKGYLEAGEIKRTILDTAVITEVPVPDGKSNQGIRVEHWAAAFTTAIDYSYWEDAVLLVNANTLGKNIWTLKDSGGRPAYIPNATMGAPGMLLGVRVFVQPQMKDIAASADIALYGDARLFEIRDASGFEYEIVDKDERNVSSYMSAHYGFRSTAFGVVTSGNDGGLAIIQTAA